MKNVGIRIALAAVTAGSMMLGLSCSGPGANQVNTNTNANGQNNLVDTTIAKAPTADPCDEAGKIKAVQDSIDAEIRNDNDLQIQKTQGKFSAMVEPDPKHNIKLTIKGYVIGASQNGQGKIKDLFKIVEKHLKKGCVQRVIFQTNLTTPGFEWTICESPQKTCPNGSCIPETETCPSLKPEPSPTPKGNTNANANRIPLPVRNSNVNTNSNTNSNSGNRNN